MAVYERVNQLESSVFPSLHHRIAGVAERLRRFREASADREAGVVFRLKTKGKIARLLAYGFARAVSDKNGNSSEFPDAELISAWIKSLPIWAI